MRRLTALSVPLHLAFPESTFEAMLNSSSLLTERQAQETENWHQRYETFFSSSLTVNRSKLECFCRVYIVWGPFTVLILRLPRKISQVLN